MVQLPELPFEFMTNIEDVSKPIYSAAERNRFVNYASMSFKKHGRMGVYQYKIHERIKPCPETTKRLMELIHSKYRAIVIYFYQTLNYKLAGNKATAEAYYKKKLTISLKNEMGLKYSVGDAFAMDLPYSSFDILIGIDHTLPRNVFENLKTSASIIVSQTVSQYKRLLDSMFGFSFKTMPYSILDGRTIETFKKDHMHAMPDNVLSPFCDITIRNMCSGYSSVMTDSIVYEGEEVYVEVPHLEYCEKLPLNKSPIICSVSNKNNTYDIYFSCVDVNEKKRYAKLLSVSISSNPEGKLTSVVDPVTGVLINVPTIESSIISLYKKAYGV